MLSIPVIRMDMKINVRKLTFFYVLQLASMLIAIGICQMKLIQISDIFWDTIPVIVIPMFMQMGLAYQLILRNYENGTMHFLLASPKSIKEIFWTKATLLILNNLILFILTLVIGLVSKVYALTGMWTTGEYVFLNLGGFSLQFCIMGFCLWMSCCNEKKDSYFKFAVIIPVVLYSIYLVYYLVDTCWFLQYITIFSLFRQQWYRSDNFLWIVGCAVFSVLGISFFILARKAFFKRIANDR